MSLEKTTRWRKKYPGIAMLVGVATFLILIAGAASGIEELRWWVWRGEFSDRNAVVDRQLKKRSAAVDRRFDNITRWQKSASKRQGSLNIDVLQGQLYVVLRELRELQAANKLVPNSLYREKQRLESNIRALERRIDKP